MPDYIGPPRDAAEREAALRLRWQVLRRPLDQPRGSEVDAHEAHAVLLVAVDAGGRVLGTARLHALDAAQGQIRYMAVADPCRGRGIGRRLLAALEDAARARGLRTLRLNARETVAGFYRRHGYRAIGPGPLLLGRIPHLRMEKHLNEEDTR